MIADPTIMGQEAFVNRCRVLFEMIHGCPVKKLPYTGDYGYDMVIHSNEGDILVKCICASGTNIDMGRIKLFHNGSADLDKRRIIITEEKIPGHISAQCIDQYPNTLLIDGDSCSRLFSHYGITDDISQNRTIAGVAPVVKKPTVQNYESSLPLGKRIKAALVSVIIPGGGCILLHHYTRDGRYIPLGVALLIASFILLQFAENKFMFSLMLAVYFASIIISFVTLDLNCKDPSERKNELYQYEYYQDEPIDEESEKRAKYSFYAEVLSLFIPGGGAAILFHISRDKKHVIYGNILFWTSFFIMLDVLPYVDGPYIGILLIILQIISLIYTVRNIDADVRPLMKKYRKLFIACITAYISLHISLKYITHSLFGSIIDIICSLI